MTTKEQLEAENTRLKADVNELADGLRLASEVGIKIADEVTRLKAEVDEARRGSGAGIRVMLDLNNQLVDEIARLKAENERLRKAGDAMATNIPRMVTCQVTAHEAVDFMNDWNAAKEGKPSV